MMKGQADSLHKPDFLSSWQKIIFKKSTHLISRLKKKKKINHQNKPPKRNETTKGERTKKHVCYLMPLLHISRTPGPLPPRMHPLHIHASPTFRRVERSFTGRDGGMGRVGTHKKEGREKFRQTWLGHKDSWHLGNHGKTHKKESWEVGNYS